MCIKFKKLLVVITLSYLPCVLRVTNVIDFTLKNADVACHIIGTTNKNSVYNLFLLKMVDFFKHCY